jgi:glycosyltransferase involved in cell wall biosynthesis
MRMLFIHQNIPGQFTHQIAALCADPSQEVWAIGEEAALARCARSHPRLKLLQVSAAHVYLTYPFVLSWSMLEAMSAGALLIASRTAPVEEVLVDGANGCLVDFFDKEALVERVTQALAEPKRFAPLRQAARETVVTRYDLRSVCLPASLALLRRVAGSPA